MEMNELIPVIWGFITGGLFGILVGLLLGMFVGYMLIHMFHVKSPVASGWAAQARSSWTKAEDIDKIMNDGTNNETTEEKEARERAENPEPIYHGIHDPIE